MQEFKRFSSNPMANKVFKSIIQRIRKDQENLYHGPLAGKFRKNYLPFNLKRLLEYLSHMNKREILIEKIEREKYGFDSTKDNVKSFIKLFLIDGLVKDKIIHDENSADFDRHIRGRKKSNSNYLE